MNSAALAPNRPDITAPETSARAADIVLAARDCTVAFGAGKSTTVILDRVSVDLTREETVCVIGPSGCGKTTLLRALAGLQPLSGGEVMFERGPVHRPCRDLAVVFQDYGRALLPWRTVAQNVSLALEARRVPRHKRAAIVAPLLAQVGLQDHADHFPAQLSGGLQQRAQIARSLALEPKVLLMDEPFGALDAMTRQVLQDELQRLSAANKMTVLFVTHDLEEAIYLGDRVIALAAHPGRVAEVIHINLPRPRNQLTTREHPRFLELRHHLYQLLQRLG